MATRKSSLLGLLEKLENQNERLLNRGASETNVNQVNAGALKNVMSPEVIKKYVDEFMPSSATPHDKWLSAFQFFANMAAASSKPGATALGAAGEAGAATVKTLLEERKTRRAEDLARSKMGLTLAASLGKGGVFKQYPSGESAVYMTAENAGQYLINKGMPANAPTFASTVKKLTAPSESMVGKPVVIADSFQMLAPVVYNNKIVDFNFIPVTGGVKPASVNYREKRIPILAKENDYITRSFETLPTVQIGMDLLLTGDVETGGLAELTLPIKNIFGQLFGVNDPSVQNLQIIQSISNVLAPKMRPVGSGSTSDMEFKAYQRAIADIGNKPKANYISLYTFKKRTENAAIAAAKEREILTSGGTSKDVDAAIDKIDRGLYSKYKGEVPIYSDAPEYNGLSLERKAQEDTKYNKLYDWWQAVPRGTVVYNRSAKGKKLFSGEPIFVIKDWGTDR
jgi:hypothetical protein|tara:strand:- start:10060 stop:11421 length:1362 start_codon:yes stop_codon:yes gene_type:complete